MDRMKHLVSETLKKRSQMGKKIKNPGAHMYHAATGVADGGKSGHPRQAKLKKAFARMRSMHKDHYDEGTHRYSSDTGK